MIKCIFIFFSLFLPILAVAQDVKDSVSSAQSTNDQKFEKEIFVPIDEVPDFPGGDYARMLFLHQNVNYPIEAKINGIDGTVYVEFIIEKDG